MVDSIGLCTFLPCLPVAAVPRGADSIPTPSRTRSRKGSTHCVSPTCLRVCLPCVVPLARPEHRVRIVRAYWCKSIVSARITMLGRSQPLLACPSQESTHPVVEPRRPFTRVMHSTPTQPDKRETDGPNLKNATPSPHPSKPWYYLVVAQHMYAPPCMQVIKSSSAAVSVCALAPEVTSRGGRGSPRRGRG